MESEVPQIRVLLPTVLHCYQNMPKHAVTITRSMDESTFADHLLQHNHRLDPAQPPKRHKP